MMRFARTGSWCAALAISLVTILTACTEEEPTGIGGDLLPGGDIETFEVFLDPDQYLVLDTSFSGYTRPGAALQIAAREFEGVYNANTILRFGRPPSSISVQNAQGSVVSDTAPRYIGGEIIVRIDTLRSTNNGVAPIAIYTTAEEWDGPSATWTHRVDTAGVRLAWTQPGGTPGELLGRGARTAGDSVFIPIDSATIADWADLDSNVRGAIISLDPDDAATVGERLRFTGMALRLRARSSIDTDTVVTVTSNVSSITFVYDPPPPAAATPIRVGGIPAWRTYMEFKENLKDIEVPCVTISSTCRVRLGDVDISRAELVLETAQSPDGLVPEDTLHLVAQLVLRSPSVPIERSPLASVIPGGITTDEIKPASFRAQAPDTVFLSLGSYIRALASDEIKEEDRPPRAIALMANPESGTVGVASFVRRPRLRLILTVDPEVVR